MDFLIVIPARFNSSRYPGKPLADINGKSMIQRVWEKCVIAVGFNNVLVATDDERIVNHCSENGILSVMTSDECLTGSDRVYEVALGKYADIYINVQGDEPLILEKDIKNFINFAKKK